MSTKAARESRHAFTFRISDDQLEAVTTAKQKAERQTGFAPSDQSIGEGMMAQFCERYGVNFPRHQRKPRGAKAHAHRPRIAVGNS